MRRCFWTMKHVFPGLQVQHLLLSDPHNAEYTEIYDNLSEVS